MVHGAENMAYDFLFVNRFYWVGHDLDFVEFARTQPRGMSAAKTMGTI